MENGDFTCKNAEIMWDYVRLCEIASAKIVRLKWISGKNGKFFGKIWRWNDRTSKPYGFCKPKLDLDGSGRMSPASHFWQVLSLSFASRGLVRQPWPSVWTLWSLDPSGHLVEPSGWLNLAFDLPHGGRSIEIYRHRCFADNSDLIQTILYNN